MTNGRRIFSSVAILFLLSATQLPHAAGYILNQRWSSTATNGNGLGLGDPTTITWSIMPDGSNIPGEGTSDLISFLDNVIGGSGGADLTQRPWFPAFEASFARWDALSGVTYVYEPNDDGVNHDSLPGQLGVRGDARIGGTFLDGQSGVLAYNYFPDSGDMALDTGDSNFYGNTQQNSIRLRNVLMHEAGHGLGYSHVESNDSGFLMEPFINISFDGPQFDEIRGIHRGYGDRWEENGGNDTIGSAISLGSAGVGMTTLAIGTDASDDTVVAASDVDFVSIDDNGDADFFSFSVDNAGTADFRLSPKGATYFQGPQGGSQSLFNAKTVSDLTLSIYDSNQSLVQTVDNAGVGNDELLDGFALDQAGTYFARVTGDANNVQLYTLEVDLDIGEGAGPDGDFNDNDVYGCEDIDALVVEIVAGTNSPDFDLTGDGDVDMEDLAAWRAEAGDINLGPGLVFLEGDADLDGYVDGRDALIWNGQKFTATSAWCSGDFDASGAVDDLDYAIWRANRFSSSFTSGAPAVPEPTGWICLAWGLVALLPRRGR